MSPQRRPVDTGANYNTFGWDPYGCIAYLCTFFFGPKYVPLLPSSQFGGPPEPPRYGPPAYYQIACLPAGFTPQAPPNYSQEILCLGGMSGSEGEFLIPPAIFDPCIFDAFTGLERFLEFAKKSCELINFEVMKQSDLRSEYSDICGMTFASQSGCLNVEDDEGYDDSTEAGSEPDSE